MMCRFSDNQLQDFYDQFSKYKEEFDAHVETFTNHIDKEEESWKEIMNLTNQNKLAIEEHVRETKALIEIYKTGFYSKKMLVGLGKFAQWLASIGVVATAYHYFTEHFLR